MSSLIKQFATDPIAFLDALVIPSAKGRKPFKEVMGDYQREWFKTIAPSLVAVCKGETPPIGRYWVERTKGGSKDSDVGLCLLYLLAFSTVKLDMEVGAADKEQAGEMKKAMEDVLRLNSWLADRVEVQSWHVVCKATGSQCRILATDVAGSHGSRPDVVVMNELSHVQKQEFAENLLDNATKKPQGLVIVATNSGFTESWQDTWRKMAIESDRWHTHFLSEPAPWLSDEEIDEAQRRNSSARFNRLYWGQWVSQSGDALDQDDIQACVLHKEPPIDDWADYTVAGLDLGVKQDHSAVVVLGGNYETGQLRLLYAQRWKPVDGPGGKVSLMQVENTVELLNRRFDLTWCGYDPFEAMLLSERLVKASVPMKEVPFRGKQLDEMATHLLDVFRSRRIELFEHPALIADLGRLTIEEKSYGHRLSATRTEQGHADLATALAIALPIAVEVGSDKDKYSIVREKDFWWKAAYRDPHVLDETFREERALLEAMPVEYGPSGSAWKETMRAVGRLNDY